MEKRNFNLVGKEVVCKNGCLGYRIELLLDMNKVEESEDFEKERVERSEEIDNRGDFLIRLYELNNEWYDKYLVDERFDIWKVNVNI
jgi:hypothetical protein